MAYITNDGSRLIERARTEGKSIVFGSVRMNTIYKSDPYSLVQQTDEWFGENHGLVVGCISHVSIDEVSQVCDSKLAVQTDNSESWKSIGIYAHLDGGGDDELLFACESIENGEYKDVTIVELPVTLDGVVADFGLSEGGSGGGGGGEVPANMMTTNTEQNGLSGTKTWEWEYYYGVGTVDEPQEGDRRAHESISINDNRMGEPAPLFFNSESSKYSVKGGEGSWSLPESRRLRITSGKVALNDLSATLNDLSATWADIIRVANNNILAGQGTVQDLKGTLTVFGNDIRADSVLKTDGLSYTFDSSGYLSSVYLNYFGKVATIGVVVRDAGLNVVENGRVSGFSMDEKTPLTFQSPIQLAVGYTITYQAIISPNI